MIEGVIEFNQQLMSIFDQLPRNPWDQERYTGTSDFTGMVMKYIEFLNQRVLSDHRKNLLQSLKDLLEKSAKSSITPTFINIIPYKIHNLYVSGIPDDLDELSDDDRLVFCILPDHPFDPGILSKTTSFPREKRFFQGELKKRTTTSAFIQGILDGRIQSGNSPTVQALLALDKIPIIERDPDYEEPRINIPNWRTEFYALHGQYP